MARAISIQIFLIDGSADGKIKAHNNTWNCVAYKIPRDRLGECKDFEAFNQSGVYILFGGNGYYVGQAEVRVNGKAILTRIMEHTRDEYADKWDEVVMLTDKSKSLGLTDISYLENQICVKANKAGRYKMLNGRIPSPGSVAEEKKSDLDQLLDWAELLLGAMGYKLFEPAHAHKQNKYQQMSLPINKPIADDDKKVRQGNAGNLFYLVNKKSKTGREYDAKMLFEGDKTFKLIKGSRVALVPTGGCVDRIRLLRKDNSKC